MIDTAIDQDTDCIAMGLTGLIASCLQALNVLRHVPQNNFAADLDEARLDEAREISKRLLAS